MLFFLKVVYFLLYNEYGLVILVLIIFFLYNFNLIFFVIVFCVLVINLDNVFLSGVNYCLLYIILVNFKVICFL